MRRIEIAGKASHGLLRKLKEDGKSVACFGASATTATLVYQFGIADLFDFYIDDNSIKIGKLSPSEHIPVYNSKSLLDKKPDAVYIAAWRYWEPIVKNNLHYVEQGGLYIIPLPAIKFVSYLSLP
jgi:hypothetical protein